MCSLKFIKIQIKTVLIKTLAVTKIVFFVHGPKRTGQHTWQRAKLVFVTGLHWYKYISSYTNKKSTVLRAKSGVTQYETNLGFRAR